MRSHHLFGYHHVKSDLLNDELYEVYYDVQDSFMNDEKLRQHDLNAMLQKTMTIFWQETIERAQWEITEAQKDPDMSPEEQEHTVKYATRRLTYAMQQLAICGPPNAKYTWTKGIYTKHMNKNKRIPHHWWAQGLHSFIEVS
ncbi:hypothetical protein R1flu_022402 [Riccia fluitans]|uniref:Uncharacterized protein n=1 Tax=Riccia fluitans TaxID=41844 RepID=A0ABD1ZV50_9MARC